MLKYDVYTLDNREQIDGYAKIGTYPLQPQELSDYTFPTNNSNITLDVVWLGSRGEASWAKFGIALQSSDVLNIRQLSPIKKNTVIDKPIAYIRTETGFDIYVRSNLIITSLKTKVSITESQEPRFIPLNGNPFIDLSSFNAAYLDIKTINIDDNSNVVNSQISNISNGYFYFGTPQDSTAQIELPGYASNKRYIIRVRDITNTTLKGCDIGVMNGNVNVQNLYDSSINASISDSKLTLTGLEYYSFCSYEIIILQVNT